MLWTSILALPVAVSAVAVPHWMSKMKRQGAMTMLRFGCAQVVIDRLDPLVNPGQMPSPHVHQVRHETAYLHQQLLKSLDCRRERLQRFYDDGRCLQWSQLYYMCLQ
jgi:hypothetical protein